MKTAVIFLMTGPSHLPNLCVSLMSLRNVWDGMVFVYAWEDSFEIAEKICKDHRINAVPVLCHPTHGYRGKNSQEISKIDLIQQIKDYDVVVYLDADLIIKKSIQPLIDATDNESGSVITQFNSWSMRNGIPRGRVKRLLQFPEVDAEWVHESMKFQYPALNSGVFACRPDAPMLPEWGRWTEISRTIYISGESALHPISLKYKIPVLRNGVFNCSTKYQSPSLPDEDVAIWHFHGDSNTRYNKSPRGVRMWYPEFEKIMDQNVGEIEDWINAIPNRFLVQLRANGIPQLDTVNS